MTKWVDWLSWTASVRLLNSRRYSFAALIYRFDDAHRSPILFNEESQKWATAKWNVHISLGPIVRFQEATNKHKSYHTLKQSENRNWFINICLHWLNDDAMPMTTTRCVMCQLKKRHKFFYDRFKFHLCDAPLIEIELFSWVWVLCSVIHVYVCRACRHTSITPYWFILTGQWNRIDDSLNWNYHNKTKQKKSCKTLRSFHVSTFMSTIWNCLNIVIYRLPHINAFR